MEQDRDYEQNLQQLKDEQPKAPTTEQAGCTGFLVVALVLGGVGLCFTTESDLLHLVFILGAVALAVLLLKKNHLLLSDGTEKLKTQQPEQRMQSDPTDYQCALAVLTAGQLGTPGAWMGSEWQDGGQSLQEQGLLAATYVLRKMKQGVEQWQFLRQDGTATATYSLRLPLRWFSYEIWRTSKDKSKDAKIRILKRNEFLPFEAAFRSEMQKNGVSYKIVMETPYARHSGELPFTFSEYCLTDGSGICDERTPCFSWTSVDRTIGIYVECQCQWNR